MQSRRTLLLMGILLVLLAGYLGRTELSGLFSSEARPERPLPGANSIVKFTVTHEPNGEWMAHVDYFYTGEPVGAHLLVKATRSGDSENALARYQWSATKVLERGGHHVDIALVRPGRHRT